MGPSGDAVQFIDSKTMEILGEQNKVTAIEAADKLTIMVQSSSALRLRSLSIPPSVKPALTVSRI